jgi:hypothetical protein
MQQPGSSRQQEACVMMWCGFVGGCWWLQVAAAAKTLIKVVLLLQLPR